MAFLNTEYRVLAKFVVVVAILLAFVNLDGGTERSRLRSSSVRCLLLQDSLG